MNEDWLPPTLDTAFEGRVDHCAGGIISGWAAIRFAEKPCPLEIVGPSGFYARSLANNYRSDLDSAGKQNGHCAFSVSTGLPETFDASEFAVLPAGLPHRFRGPEDDSLAPIADWLETSPDRLAQELVVHRCHYAMTGHPAPMSLLASARPAQPFNATAISATLALVQAHVQSPAPQRQQDDVTSIVQNVYRGVLRREAEPLGIELYGRALMSGMTLAQFIEELIGMPEFLQAAGLRRADMGPASSTPASDGFLPEIHRVSESIEKALLTLAVAASREKPRIHPSDPPLVQTREQASAPILVADPPPSERPAKLNGPGRAKGSEGRRRRA